MVKEVVEVNKHDFQKPKTINKMVIKRVHSYLLLPAGVKVLKLITKCLHTLPLRLLSR